MDVTPSQISGAVFRTVRKGYDPAEVDALLRDAAAALEHAQQQATAMEARARAAVARLQEQSDDRAEAPASEPARAEAGADDADRIGRTLLLAQETADRAISEAEAEAARLVDDARVEAERTVEESRASSAQILDDARAEARRLSENERLAAIDEVERLKARREFLLGDVDQLETFLVDQRDRLRSAAREIEALAARVPDGLGQVAAPLMSASDDDADDDQLDDTGELAEAATPDEGDDDAVADLPDDAVASDDDPTSDEPPAGDAADEPTDDEDEYLEFDRDDVGDATGDVGEAPGELDRRTVGQSDPTPVTAAQPDEDAEIEMPPETRMPFADASELARALDGAELPSRSQPSVFDDDSRLADVPVVDDTGELDATQVMEALDRRVEAERATEQLDFGSDNPPQN